MHPALWQRAFTSDGFEWIDADNAQQSIISFARHGDDPADDLVILINFDVASREEFRMGVPRPGYYEEVFNTDDERFGGSGVTNAGVRFESEDKAWNGREQSFKLRVPPLGGMVLRYAGPLPKKAKKAATKKATAKKQSAKKTTKKATKKTADKK